MVNANRDPAGGQKDFWKGGGRNRKGPALEWRSSAGPLWDCEGGYWMAIVTPLWLTALPTAMTAEMAVPEVAVEGTMALTW